MKRFALTGAAGYVAPRHLQAIHDTGNTLVAALDRSDSVGILDRFFPEANFFTEFERFDRHIEKLRREGEGSRIHYVSICSPNYLHDAHIRFALRVGADAICEKPLVLNPWNIEALEEMEKETGRRVWTILQLRLHPAIVQLKKEMAAVAQGKKQEVDLTYITSRGRWYAVSWKGDVHKSGGVATNIGIHFFDMLLWIFGGVERNEVHLSTPEKASGYLELKKARVRWFLSLDQSDLPLESQAAQKRTFRSLAINGRDVEFSDGFADLHTAVYRETLDGHGYGLGEALPSVQLAHDIRHAATTKPKNGQEHPKLAGALS
jgi:UDP-N-acetyl-2-amino-2-deoxyglucuronate dehydrogenase